MLINRIVNVFTILQGNKKTKRTTSTKFEIIDVRALESRKGRQNSSQICVSFHNAMRWFLFVLCLLSIFPVSGILHTNPHHLSYKKISLRSILALGLLVFATIETCCSIRWFLSNNFGFSKAMSVVFFLSSTSFMYLFHFVTRNWRTYVMYWEKYEKVFLREPYTAPGVNLARLLPGIGCAALLVALIEHICFITGALIHSYETIVYCNATTTTSVIELAFFQQRTHILVFTGYSNWMIPLLEWTNVCMTLAWNSGDIFIVVVSIALIIRFKQFNIRISSINTKQLSEDEWRELRTHYGHLVDLTRKTDKLISNLIFLSCSSNLYFICMFLFHAWDTRPHPILHVQHWITTLCLIFRTFMVLFLGASVYETSKQVLPKLKAVTGKSYNLEIKRFIDQVIAEPAVLSGKGFFYLTKPSILAMTGIIITYEIVLMDQVKRDPDEKVNCQFF